MSAARAAARVKPVVVVKSGRHAQGAKAAQTHTGALAGSDSVYEAAFRRAGLLRVLDLEKTLGRVRPFPGKRLAILTKRRWSRVLAVDRLADLGGTLAGISPETMKKLDAALPPIWSRATPVDIAGDADAARYAAAFKELLEDPANDAILVMSVPTALASAEERHTALRDGTKILVRPVRPEDEPLYGPFFAAVTPQDLRLRFFAPVKEFGHTFIARFTQIEYARAMAFIAIEESSRRLLGVVRLHADANYERGEYAILVRSDLKRPTGSR